MNVALRVFARNGWCAAEGGEVVGHGGVVHGNHVPRLFGDDGWLVAASDMCGLVVGDGW